MAKIAIVNHDDEIIGSAEKSEARKNGQIHRLVRILLLDSEGKILIQRRHPKADDAPNKWDFSVAGHVDENENYKQAAKREVEEELGLVKVPLKPLFKFYAEKRVRADHVRRFNMVFVGKIDPQLVQPNFDEIGSVAWLTKAQIESMLRDHPESFSTGFREKYSEILEYLDALRAV